MSLKNVSINKRLIEKKGELVAGDKEKGKRDQIERDNNTRLLEKRKEKEIKCENHNLDYFSNKALKTKNKNEYLYKFCANCNGLFIYNEEIKILKTISNLSEEITSNYFNPFFIFQEEKKNYKNENLIYVTPFLKYRKDMLSFVFKLKNKYKASSNSYFLAIRLIDIVCAKIIKFEIDLELISIACFFLACKNKIK
jgi:hypothetical protein